ncbi:MAG: amidophosphoribosyltransferase [bacterium]
MCGIFGIYGHEDAVHLSYLGLYALQHRGEEGSGIVTYDGKETKIHKNLGLVGNVFNESILKSIKGNLAIAHVRYSTTGSNLLKNVQPILVSHKGKSFAIAHNGNFVNTFELKKLLEDKGSIFQTTTDSELLLHLFTQSKKKDYKEKLIQSLSKIKGSYSIVMMINDTLVGMRDPFGFRPLCLGQLGQSYILTSETCVLDLIGAKYIREIEPGEIVFINEKGIESIKFSEQKKHSMCIFEFIYFARPDSNIFGKNVYLTRKNLGRKLAQEFSIDADFVIPIPDSGSYASVGFAEESKIPYEMGLIRNHYIGRTFIQPSQFVRNFKVKIKLNGIREILKQKKIVVIEDSIVRGTTIQNRINMLREFGAKKIYMGVSCPPIKFPCFYGIDFPDNKELIAAHQSVEQIQKILGLDGLKYLSLEGMLDSMLLPKKDFCTACFNGKYPIKYNNNVEKNVLEKFI